MEDYFAFIKEIQLKLGEGGRIFPNKDGHLIELVLMNLRTLCDVLCSSFHANWMSHKEDFKDFTFDTLCDLLIKDQHKLLDERKLGNKH